MPRDRKHELRCFCAGEPLLGTYGLKNGKLYVHVRIYKQKRIFGEMYVTDGRVQLRCRNCLRWHTVVIRQPGRAVLQESNSLPEGLSDDPVAPMLAPTDPTP